MHPRDLDAYAARAHEYGGPAQEDDFAAGVCVLQQPAVEKDVLEGMGNLFACASLRKQKDPAAAAAGFTGLAYLNSPDNHGRRALLAPKGPRTRG
ncbi:hypothetical protein ACFVJM_27840 [Streptomyces virginiae]|uniref:hypothetical protein n=1 Tax=Streptomyces virginiae TaxID=1961 RepID=UPI0036382B4A